MNLIPIIYLTGIFSLILGIFHFCMPVLLDFRSAIPEEGPPLKPFRFLFFQYNTKRSDIYGIAWVMNHCVSLVLVTIGLLDLTVDSWLSARFSTILFLWIAAWWFLRAGTQFYLGKRRGDWLVFGWFSLLGLVHMGMAIL